MDSFNFLPIKKNNKISFFYKIKGKISIIKIVLIFLCISNLYLIFFIFILKKNFKFEIYEIKNKYINNLNNQITNQIEEINNKLNIIENRIGSENLNNINIYKENNNILLEYIIQQNNFCDYQEKFYNKHYEDLIRLTNFSFKGISYQIYTYKKFDNYMSNEIIETHKYEPTHMSNFLEVLKYYGKKNNIKNNKDIFMLDIGGNIGSYPSFLGKFGYSILTFEASPRNYYILNKNYCNINRYSNIIIINKGISNEEKKCNYYSQIDGIGNGILLCNENKTEIETGGYYFNKSFEVNLTKLSNFLPFLSNKNIALIKLDIEGGEGKAIEDGIELINKYHVPYIFSEYNPRFLIRHGTDPKEFLQLFINNGYKISLDGFLSKNYLSIDKIKGVNNLYFIYNKN